MVTLIWITLGSVFAGAVHDYFSGMLPIKHNGLSITEMVERNLHLAAY
jgi:carbon starvation protein CstA